MKTQLVILMVLVCLFKLNAQTDGWHLFTKPSEISKIIPDDINANELHIATDIGYIKYNTSSNMVTDMLNLTSQVPAITNVKDIALDPTSNDIAMTIKNGIAIYNGSTLSVYTYDTSDLTIGESTSQFRYLKVAYAKDGTLYIFKEDAFGYQIFDNSVFQNENTTTFRPQDVVENSAGTKAFFATSSKGLWELDKGTDTWTNFTPSNSDVVSNNLTSLFMSTTDLLYIGGYSGLNTLSDSGVWNTYQENDPVNAFPYNIFDISLNETSGELLLQTSLANSYYFGITLANLSTSTWTNYRDNDANCLNENVFTATTFDATGKIYVAPQIFSSIPDIGKLVEFTPSPENCSTLNINYLNAPVATGSNTVADFSIRKKPSGNFDIGFTRTNDVHISEINPTTFNGTFSAPSTLTPSAGNFTYSIIGDNNYFIVENNAGWVFIDENNTLVPYAHGISDYLAIVTKKSTVADSNDGFINLIHKGFDASFNYRVYKTRCNTATGTCTAPEEIFTNDRDLSKNIIFGSSENSSTNKTHAVALKTDNSGNLKRTQESWEPNQPAVNNWDRIHDVFPRFDPVVFSFVLDDLVTIASLFAPAQETDLDIKEDDSDGGAFTETKTFDSNNNGNNEDIETVTELVLTDDEATKFIAAIIIGLEQFNSDPRFNHFATKYLYLKNIDPITKRLNSEERDLTDTSWDTSNLPEDFSIRKAEIKQYSSTEAFMVLFTNYGMLIKTAIDISNLLLDVKQYQSNINPIVLFPNPALDTVSFSNKSILKTEIFDLNGRKLLSTNGYTISVKSLPNGLYVAKGATQDNKTISRKLIKI
ncbi:T9SS type A sorting domain-containing protein [Hyunsoonleella sp. SJ7]|uniref:T9SS type A sorting domain-containing protein n=1 Tax=Hyunsoonleella aquatilis TaxID=2762758 RepID=A0A923H9M6_9FLAO|nr:T9SS type A sorting domain-containing protein [Hyunsoonleella aquatilis]MBC3759871.1 T9SS type A sorting domain-containing protein [Hyunsoonleella aquatilis]